MCFIKSSKIDVAAQAVPERVERHTADASLTKNSQKDNEPKGYLQNLKTTPLGLEDIAQTQKKTLLGE